MLQHIWLHMDIKYWAMKGCNAITIFSPLMLILSLALPNMLVHKVSFSLLWEYFFLWDIELQRNNFMALVSFTSEIS